MSNIVDSTFIKDIQARAELAKLNFDDLLQPCQHLKFIPHSDEEFTVMQVDESMLKSLEDGKSLVIRGDGNDSAVLCTDSVTYDIKNAATSNTLILCNDLDVRSGIAESITENEALEKRQWSSTNKQAVSWTNSYYELKRISPHTGRLVDLLSLSPYRGPQYEADIRSDDKFSLSDLQNVVQASDVEIITKLTQLNCCCISGKWRMLDFGYVVECIGEILQLVESESWSCGQIPIEEACSKINDSGELVPCFITKHLLRCYGSQFAGDDGTIYCKLDERKVCRFFAEMLLKDVGRFNYSEFLTVWKESVPCGMVTDNAFLRGIALIDYSSQPPSIFLFKSEDLPLELESRFDKLFENREKWTLDEITPYIEEVCTVGQTVSSLLTKFTRNSTMNGVKVFSTRKLTRPT